MMKSSEEAVRLGCSMSDVLPFQNLRLLLHAAKQFMKTPPLANSEFFFLYLFSLCVLVQSNNITSIEMKPNSS